MHDAARTWALPWQNRARLQAAVLAQAAVQAETLRGRTPNRIESVHFSTSPKLAIAAPIMRTAR